MKKVDLKSNKFWIILFSVIIVVSVVILLIFGQSQARYARIYKNGTLTETVNLLAVTDTFTIIIDDGADPSGILYGFNLIDVEYGRIRVANADCPGGACIRQGWISSGVIPIVCLPNRLVISLESSDIEISVDAVVG